MLAGARCLNGGVESQEIGLLRKIVDHLDDFADVIGPLTEHTYDLARRTNRGVNSVQSIGGLVHGCNPAVNLFAGTIGDVQQDSRGIGYALDRRDHLIYGSRSLADAGGLGLRTLDHVLHVDAHLVHGAGDFVDRGRSL